jgi:exopolysaccharide biosynthesis polyprenyl glycosylphosphotransferase
MTPQTGEVSRRQAFEPPVRQREVGRLRLVRQLRRGSPRLGEGIPEGRSSIDVLKRDAVYRSSLATADLAATVAGMVAGVYLLGEAGLTAAAFATLPLVIVVCKMLGLYDRDEQLLRKTTLDEAPQLFQVATLYTILIWLGEGVFASGSLSRPQVLGFWILMLVLLLAFRAAARGIVTRTAAAERCLVLGDSRNAANVRDKIESSLSLNARVIGCVPLQDNGHADGSLAVLGSMDMLGAVLVEHDVHRVIIVPTTPDSDEILDAIRLVKSMGMKVSVLPRLFEVVGSSVEFDDLHGLMLLGVPRYGLSQSSRALKRSMDLVGAALGVIALAPLFLWVSLAIKLNSPGPVFFRQTRVGRDNRCFEILKFRTMVHDAEARKDELRKHNEAADGFFKIADDPRITRVGGFLRRTSLDELPQLFNVIKGDMSLVGPRPLVPDEDCRLQGWQRKRLYLKPGMTGLWQIFGSSRIPMHEMVKIDYLYTGNWSLWVDVKTLLRTVPHVLSRRGL